MTFDPRPFAESLSRAWQSGVRIPAASLPVADEAQGYAVQDALIARLGPAAGWKVGAPDDASEPNGAPLPTSCVLASGARLGRNVASVRGIELEVAVRLRADLRPGGRLLAREEIAAAIEAVMPAIELVDSRLVETRAAPAPARLADLQSHGALVLGAPAALDPLSLDFTRLHTRLWFDGELKVDTTGGHTAPDVWRLLAWLARHAEARGLPLRAGQVVTTGSCTGLLVAGPGARVEGEITGLGRVDLQV